MIKYYILVILVYTSVWGQKWPSEEFLIKYNYMEVIGDVQMTSGLTFAMYPNGKQGVNTFLSKNITLPKTNELSKNNGKVLLEYIVEKNGKINEIKIIQSAGKPYDDEAIRVLKKMDRWIPGKKDGKAVRISYRQPFNFE